MDFLNSVAGVLSFGLPFGLPLSPGFQGIDLSLYPDSTLPDTLAGVKSWRHGQLMQRGEASGILWPPEGRELRRSERTQIAFLPTAP